MSLIYVKKIKKELQRAQDQVFASVNGKIQLTKTNNPGIEANQSV